MARVLLVAEEEPTAGRVVARLALEAAGHTVEEVFDGQNALAQADLGHPDVLVLDTSLPVYDGFQVLHRLRRHQALRHLPVVMLSTLPQGLGSELARVMGAIRFLPKPFAAADLAAAIDAALTAPPPAVEPAPPATRRGPYQPTTTADPSAWPAPTSESKRRPARERPRRRTGSSLNGTARTTPAPKGEAPAPPGEGVVELSPPTRRRRAGSARRPLRGA